MAARVAWRGSWLLASRSLRCVPDPFPCSGSERAGRPPRVPYKSRVSHARKRFRDERFPCHHAPTGRVPGRHSGRPVHRSPNEGPSRSPSPHSPSAAWSARCGLLDRKFAHAEGLLNKKTSPAPHRSLPLPGTTHRSRVFACSLEATSRWLAVGVMVSATPSPAVGRRARRDEQELGDDYTLIAPSLEMTLRSQTSRNVRIPKPGKTVPPCIPTWVVRGLCNPPPVPFHPPRWRETSQVSPSHLLFLLFFHTN